MDEAIGLRTGIHKSLRWLASGLQRNLSKPHLKMMLVAERLKRQSRNLGIETQIASGESIFFHESPRGAASSFGIEVMANDLPVQSLRNPIEKIRDKES